MDFKGRTALVTGASSGIGAAFTRELAARGCQVVLVARREQRLTELAAEIENRYARPAHVVVADLSLPTAPAAVHAATEKLGLHIDILVNNAGFATYGPFDTIDPDREHAMVMVNAAAVVDLTHHYLPGMLTEGGGAVINVSSVAAFQAVPFQAVYAASKAFVEAFSESLWAEYRARGIRIVACCPSATDTEYFQVLGNDDEARMGPKRPPEGVVRDTLRALERNRPHVVIGYPWKLVALVPRVVPRATMARFGERIMRPNRHPGSQRRQDVPPSR
ncbi:SDR family oxidoreductase [Streptomyces sp. NBC_01717]|uniref:SDR family NAD(P)-dependent oxidoreductase n=1 Tax=Streptomyces sp. NBC_01717 TaxID=2975918 RepID=UPI002E30CF64|nr:SDR family oxidoreductase [Streptomyces sp. NBC_01717]